MLPVLAHRSHIPDRALVLRMRNIAKAPCCIRKWPVTSLLRRMPPLSDGAAGAFLSSGACRRNQKPLSFKTRSGEAGKRIQIAPQKIGNVLHGSLGEGRRSSAQGLSGREGIVQKVGLQRRTGKGANRAPIGCPRWWYTGAAGTANEYGLANGRANGTFDPYASIARQGPGPPS